MQYFLYTFLMFVFMISYFKVADHYNIIDKPNERSSHTEVTIRGGGIVLLVSSILSLIMHLSFWMPIVGMLIIGVISFIDDRITLSNKIRLLFHLAAVTLLFISTNVFQLYSWYICIALYIVCIGIINAYNFMDGINGITGLYSLVILFGLQYVNHYITPFIEPDLIWLPILATLVFLFFNLRKKAKCFAGDVGSISIAFWISFLILKLVVQTDNYIYILFLAVYGVDATLTIIHRLILKQNIFKAHRLHFYQILANDQKWPHLLVSASYAIIQATIIGLIIFVPFGFSYLFFLTTMPLAVCYISFKGKLMKKSEF